MKFNPLYINLLISSLILLYMFIRQDNITKKIWLWQYKSFLKHSKKFDKGSIKKIKTANEVIDFIEKYYKNNADKIKYEKKILYTKVNNIKSIDAGNYVNLIITLIITALIAFYSLAGSLNISTFINKIEIVNSINKDITDELNSSSKDDNKTKKLYDNREKAINDLNKQKEDLVADFSMENGLFQTTAIAIAFVLNFIIITVFVNHLHNAQTSYKVLCLQVIEDIEKDILTQNINLANSIDLIEKSIIDADLTLRKCYESLSKTDLYLKNLDNKNKAYLAISDLKSINDKNKK